MSDPCIYCGHDKRLHIEDGFACGAMHCYCQRWADKPTDNEMQRPVYVPDTRQENDWRL